MAAWFRPALLGAMLLVMAPLVSAQPATPGRALFDQWDANRDGRVSWAEAWDSIERRFADADTNRNDGIGLEEWLAAQLPGRPVRADRPAPDPQRQRDRRMAMFRAIDANRDDQVTLAEIRPVAESWFRAIDANGDGAVGFEEVPQSRQRPAVAR